MRKADIDSGAPLDAEILVEGPFAASTLFWRARRGELRCTILAKTTYALLPGMCPVVDPSEPLQPSDAHWDGAPEKSVRTPSDRVPFKHQPEVLLVGHAYAPGRRPHKRLGVRLVVGDLDAALEVFPPRRFGPDGALEEPSGVRMPLAYEYAAGGSDSDNPVGVDTGLVDAWGRRGAPSVLPLGATCEDPSDVVPAAGWGPIAASWPSRARRLRAEDRAWLADPSGAPMPASFDVRYFQSAPHGHWLSGPIRPDERLVLEHLSPAHARLVTNLEGIVPYATMLGAKELRVPLIADTLFIDTDRAFVTLTWRGMVMVDARSPRLLLSIARATGRVSGPPPPPIPSAPPEPMRDRAALMHEIETTHVETPFGGVAAMHLPFSVAAPSAQGAVLDYDDDALPFRTPDADLAMTKQRPAYRATPAPPAPVSLPSSALPAPSGPSTTPSPPPRPSTRVPSPPPPPPPRFGIPTPPPAFGDNVSPPSSSPAPLPRPSFAALEPPLLRPSFAGAPAPEASRTAAKAWAPPVLPAPEASREGPIAGGWTSLRAASDAAADRAANVTKQGEKKGDPMRGAFEQSGEARRFALVDLLAHDAALPARLRRTSAFAKILASSAERPPWVRPDEPHEGKPRDERERADVLRVLSFSAPCDLTRTRELIEEAFDDAAQLDLPLVVIAGTLKPTHDDLAVLRATVHAGQPLSLPNKPLQAALKVLEEAIEGGVAPPGEATAALMRQAEQAAGPLWSYLFSQVQRTVLEERQFKRRTVLGEVRIRADFATPNGESVPAYIPATVASKLPMLPSFPAVVLAELRPREDAQEAHAEALLVWALGRVVRQAGAGRGK